MLIDLNQVMLNADGTVLKELIDKVEKEVTLRQVVLSSLRANLKGDEVLLMNEQEKLFDLLMKFTKEQDVDLEAKEITTIQDRIKRRNFGFLINVQACRLLDQKETGILLKKVKKRKKVKKVRLKING
jgi:uncharacterized protein YheU (UPF0270 family)